MLSEEEVQRKIEAINAEVDRTNREADNVLDYLQTQRKSARIQEQEEEEKLKKKGIIIGQHIPSLKSMLDVDPEVMSDIGNITDSLLIARDLIDQNKTNFLRRTGNLPISDIAAAKMAASANSVSDEDKELAHYVVRTSNTKIRESRVAVRFAETFQLRENEKAAMLASREGLPPKKTFPRKKVLTAEQRIENENILKGMNHKMNYLRNPRNNPQSVTKMLVKSKASFDTESEPGPEVDEHTLHSPSKGGGSSVNIQQQSLGGGGRGGGGGGRSSTVGTVAGASSIGGGGTSVKSGTSTKKKYGKTEQISNNPLFVSDPSAIYFTNYNIGETYTQKISFRNISAVSRSVRVLIPKTTMFALSPLQYPANCVGGMVAPGMCVTAVLTFVPDSLGDFTDFIMIQTESGNTKIPIHAHREPPNLTLPSALDVGACLVGDAVRLAVECSNTGGTGKFTLLYEYEYLEEHSKSLESAVSCLPNDPSWSSRGCLRLAPFTMYPVEFNLERGETALLNIEFVPLTMGRHSQTFYIKCDNGQMKKFTIAGTSKQVHVSVVELNSVPFDFDDEKTYKEIVFQPSHVGTERIQQTTLINDTGIPVEYEWVWVGCDVKTKDIQEAARKKIREREDSDRAKLALTLDGHPDSYHSNHQTPGSIHSGTPGPKSGGGGGGGNFGSPQSPTQVDERMLQRSLAKMESDLNVEGGNSDHHDNKCASSGGELELFPARGVLSAEGAQTFNIAFSPNSLSSVQSQAVLMIKSVPISAVRGPAQLEKLQMLTDRAHGKFHRLRSWMEEIGAHAIVDSYTAPNGEVISHKKLLNLQIIVHTIASQVERAAEECSMVISFQEYARISRWLRDIVRYVFMVRKSQANMGDDNSSVGLDNAATGGDGEENNDESGDFAIDRDPLAPITFHLYDWKLAEDGGNEVSPVPVPPLKVFPQVVQNTETSETDDEYANAQAAENPDLWEDRSNLMNLLIDSLNEQEKEMLSEVWLDSRYVLKFFGESICTVLNEIVKHEAVDYIKGISLTNMLSTQLAVRGEGKPMFVQLSPPCVQVGGNVSIGSDFGCSVKLCNQFDAMAEVEVLINQITMRRLYSVVGHDLALDDSIPTESNSNNRGGSKPGTPGLANNSGGENSMIKRAFAQAHNVSNNGELFMVNNEGKLNVTPECDRILLMPNSSSTMQFSTTIHAIGQFEIIIPFQSNNDTVRIEPLKVVVNVRGPRMKFDVAEVDLGLIAVGGEMTKNIFITNESASDAVFMMKPSLYIDFSQEKQRKEKNDGSESARSQQDGQSTSRSQAQSTARTDDFSVAQSVASSSDFKIELKNANLVVNPSTGPIAAGETICIAVTCKAGRAVQRIRGKIESRVFDTSGKIEIMSQYMNVRGEVQAPKTMNYPLLHNLGIVYVGMPVHFQVTIENMCNIPTQYKLLRPGGETSLYKLTYDKYKGPLDAKEKVVVSCTFVALTVGLVDDVISNKIFGAPVPLGFAVKCNAKGIVLEFVNVLKGESPPKCLAPPEATQFPGPEGTVPGTTKPPDARPTQPITMGTVKLYDRCQATFAIRNLSGIPCRFTLRVKKYPVLARPGAVPGAKEFGAQSSVEATDLPSFLAAGGTSHEESTTVRKILAPHESGADKFQSVMGKKHASQSVMREEDRKFLGSQKGAAYYIDVAEGLIFPWGVQVVQVAAFNDIPGCYDDHIECTIYEGEATRVFNVPVQMTVEGCPIVIEKDTTGMTTMSRQVDPTRAGQQTLHMGYQCVNCEPLVREFSVKNNGSKPGKIRWQIRGLRSKVNGPVKVSLSVDDDGVVASNIRNWSDLSRDVPFKIEPEMATIKPYGRQKFKVTLFKTNNTGRQTATVTGVVHFKEDLLLKVESALSLGADAAADMDAASAAASVMTETTIDPVAIASVQEKHEDANNEFVISMLLDGEFTHPTVSIDKNKYVADRDAGTPTVAEAANGITMKTSALQLFGSNAKMADICYRPVDVINPMKSKLIFSVTTEGPYIIKNMDTGSNTIPIPAAAAAASSSTIDAAQRIGTVAGGITGGGAAAAAASSSVTVASRATVATSGSNSSIGRMFQLFPNENGSFSIAFNPRRDVREQLLKSFGGDMGKPTELVGKLILSYSTGQSMHIPLVTKISTPFMNGSSPRLYMGVVLVRGNISPVDQIQGSVFLLSNPTDVPARWTVKHVVGGGAWKKGTAIRVAGFASPPNEDDDPDVWSITPDSGEIMGPTVSVPATMAAPPKDWTRKQDTIVPQRLVESSWATQTLTVKDNLNLKHDNQHATEADAYFPVPITIKFAPKKNVHYSSRFRFTCEFGNSFDLVLQGEGTHEEHLHKPLYPIPK